MASLDQIADAPIAADFSGWRERARAFAGDMADLVGHGWSVLSGADRRQVPMPARLMVLAPDGRLGLREQDAPIAWLEEDQLPAIAKGNPSPGLAISDELVLGLTVPAPQGPKRLLDLVLGGRALADSPFAPDATLAAWRVRSEGDQRQADLALFPAERLRPALDRLAAAGIAIVSIVPLDAEGRPLWAARPDWLAGQASARRGAGLPLAVKLLLAATLVFLAAAGARMAWLSWQLAELAPRVESAKTESRRIATLRGDSRLLLREQQRALRIVATLDDLAQRLPDGAWLAEMTLDADGLKLSGSAPSAAEALSIVNGIPTLRGAALLSAVARDAGKGLERFRIGAKTRQDTP